MTKKESSLKMKAKKIPFADEQVVRRIARLNEMSFSEERDMLEKNKGRITWLPVAVVTVILILFSGALLFFGGGNRESVIFSVSAVVFSAGAMISLRAKERRLNKRWREIRERIVEFYFTFELGPDMTFEALVKRARSILGAFAMSIVSHEQILKTSEMLFTRLTRQKLADDWWFSRKAEQIEEIRKDLAEARKRFVKQFNLAKYVLGNYLDYGRGFEPFFRRAKEELAKKREFFKSFA